MEIKITMMEAYVIFKAVDARYQYISDDIEAPQEELDFLLSVYNKMRMLKADVVIINSETSHNNNFKAHSDSPKVCSRCKLLDNFLADKKLMVEFIQSLDKEGKPS